MPSPRQDRLIGPSLRPDDVVPASGIGPALPVELFHSKLVRNVTSAANQTDSNDHVDLSTIGPLIPGQELGDELRHLRSNADTTSISINTSGSSTSGMKRDSWMTQLLPTSSSNLMAALKPRKFQQSVSGSVEAGYDSSWFKAPDDISDALNDQAEVISEKRARLADGAESHEAEYNSRMSQIRDRFQADKTPTSLLELHRKKMEKKSKKKEKKEKKKHKHHKKHRKKRRHTNSPESSSSSTSSVKPQLTRRPFDRDKDLKISRIDSAARHALIERSKQLSSRFGHGSRQFL